MTDIKKIKLGNLKKCVDITDPQTSITLAMETSRIDPVVSMDVS